MKFVQLKVHTDTFLQAYNPLYETSFHLERFNSAIIRVAKGCQYKPLK